MELLSLLCGRYRGAGWAEWASYQQEALARSPCQAPPNRNVIPLCMCVEVTAQPEDGVYVAPPRALSVARA